MDTTNAVDTPSEPAHVAALKEAIKLAGGTQAKLAEKMKPFVRPGRNPSQALIWYWLKNSILIADEWWDPIERATDGIVTRKQLRPDLFG